MKSKDQMASALRLARIVLVNERREQLDCFTMPPHHDNAEAYKQMNPDERAAIRRFDRAIAAIDEALR